MAEVLPSLTYTDEGLLSLHKIPSEHNSFTAMSLSRLEEAAERLEGLDGYEVTLLADDGARITVDVPRVLGNIKSLNSGYTKSTELLENISLFVHSDNDDVRDCVFSLDSVAPIGVVHEQFQRWLNAALIDEEVAREVMVAAATPFGNEGLKQLKRLFKFITDGQSSAVDSGGMSFGLILRPRDFGIFFEGDPQNDDGPRIGKVNWNWLQLNTIGSCACFGVDYSEIEEIYPSKDSYRLYEMSPHNVDYSSQKLSLILSAGILARKAAEYTGTEDILAEAIWD